MRKNFIFGAIAALFAGVAIAQTPVVPKVTSINPGVDLVQVIPSGNPAVGNKYGSISQLFGASSTSTTGLAGYTLALTPFRASTGATLTATATGGALGYAITAGTSESLVGEAANSSTKTDVGAIEVVLPANYVAGQNITVTVNCNYTLGSGTIGTHTLALAAYPVSSAGVQSANIVTTSAQSVPASAGTVTFTIPGANLVAGSRLWLTFTLVIQDTGGSNITGQINSISLS